MTLGRIRTVDQYGQTHGTSPPGNEQTDFKFILRQGIFKVGVRYRDRTTQLEARAFKTAQHAIRSKGWETEMSIERLEPPACALQDGEVWTAWRGIDVYSFGHWPGTDDFLELD